MKALRFYLSSMLLLLAFNVCSQHSNFVPLDKRIEKSSLIIEGKVIKQESFYDFEKEIICTANKVKIYKQFKGNYTDNEFTIITKGGDLGDIKDYFFHSFKLGLGDEGLFFLSEDDRNYNQTSLFNSTFNVLGEQDFLPYHKNLQDNNVIETPFEIYDNIERDLFAFIEREVGQKRKIRNFTEAELKLNDWIERKNPSVSRNSIENIVEYTISNPSLTGAFNEYLEFDIDIASLLTSEEFFSGDLLIDYNAITFGSNWASSGMLTITKGTVISAANYSVSITDITPSRLQVEITSSTSNPNTLYLVNSTSEDLLHIKIDITNLAGNTGIDFDELSMQGFSRFFDITTSTVEPFDLVKADDELDIDISAMMLPEIDSIVHNGVVNDTVRGGIDSIYIYGKHFGDVRTGGHWVEFTNAEKGYGWMKPLGIEYGKWSDNLIIVKVPSVGIGVQNGGSSYNNNQAGTGPVKIKTPVGYSANSSLLFVEFSFRNEVGVVPITNDFVITPNNLINRNSHGGYTISYDPSFLTYTSYTGNSTPKVAFEKALKTWRCGTGVNFIVNDSIPNDPIEPSSNPNANRMVISADDLSGDHLAETYLRIRQACDTIGGFSSDTKYYIEKFEIIIDTILPSGRLWWIDDNTTGIPSNHYDFETAVLHEIGHSHLLHHTINLPFGLDETMYASQNLAHAARNIDIHNLEGGHYVIDSVSVLPSPTNCYIPMEKVELHCEIINPTNHLEKRILNISVFPNPTMGTLNLQFDDLPNENINISIFDVLGRKVSKSWIQPQRTVKYPINFLEEGMYFFTIQVGNSSKTFKIVKI